MHRLRGEAGRTRSLCGEVEVKMTRDVENTIDNRWERFLNPEVVHGVLFSASMYVTAFEIVKNTIVDRIRNFYTDGWDEKGEIVGSEYQRNVLSRNRSPVYASLDWLCEQGAINASDIALYNELKFLRNMLAHQLFKVVTGEQSSNHIEKIPALIELLKKIEVWWIVNVDMAINPSCSDQQIDASEIVPGTVLSLQMLIEVASGNIELLEFWRKTQKN